MCLASESLTFDDCKTKLFDGKTIYKERILFQNKKHKVYTANKHQISGKNTVNKRLVQADGMKTLSRGYLTQKNTKKIPITYLFLTFKSYKNIHINSLCFAKSCFCPATMKFEHLILS